MENLLVCLFLMTLYISGTKVRGAPCTATSSNNIPSSYNSAEATQGLTILLDKLTLTCCGVITEFNYKVDTYTTGTVYFQVWRDSGTTFNLVGQKAVTITSTGTFTETLATAERISVDTGDIIGIHFTSTSNAFIAYGTAQSGDYRKISTYTTGTTSYAWAGEAVSNDRGYAVEYALDTSAAPTLNLDDSVTFQDSVAVSTTIFTVIASDTDVGDTVTTALTASSGSTTTYFQFNSATGVVSVLSSPVPPTTYTLDFTATDQCAVPGTGTLSITITNIAPTINNLPQSYNLPESQTAEVLLLTINATDPSHTPTCSGPAGVPFQIRLIPSSSDYGIYVEAYPNFDYNTVNTYNLTITCSDPYSSDTSYFLVYINKNEAANMTNLQNSTSILSYSTTTGTTIFTVTSSDKEGDQLYYNMTCSPASCPFQILSSGVIQATSDLTGSTTPGYDLFVYVYDGYTLVGPKTLTVTISDINSPPVISNLPLTNPIVVPENSLGYSIYTVSSTDANAGDTHTFTFTSNPAQGSTYIDVSSAGVITTSSTNNINYEDLTTIGTTFVLTITVSDGTDSASSTLSVQIADVNEAPTFQQSSYSINGNESTAGGSLTSAGFVVTDPEGDAVSYSLDCGSYTGSFNMGTSNGAVTFSTAYDVDTGTFPTSHTCTVTASDGSLSSTATLSITINNINDNTPTFSQTDYTYYTSGTAGVGTVLGTLSATDGDIGTYGNMLFDLNQTTLSNEYFGINTDGSLYIKQSLSSFADGQTLVITARVTDGGGLTDTATVSIVIPSTTTGTTTTTTDRYLTFFEDERNIPWFILVLLALCGFAALIGYYIYKWGSIEWCYRLNECCQWKKQPKVRTIRREPIYESPRSIPRKEPPKVNYLSNNSSWEPWNTVDFRDRLERKFN